MRALPGFAFWLSTWAQDAPVELKLPEHFLRFDITKLYSAVKSAPKVISQKILTPSTACGHIRILPTNPEIDPGIQVPYKPQVQSRMPVLEGMPSCQAITR